MPIPAALIPLIMGGAQMIGGAIKRSKKRPEYEIPESQKEALTLAKLNTGDMPGYDQMAANIALSQSNSLASARESGNVMESVGAIAGASNTAYRDLGIANRQSKRESERNLQGMLMEQAKAEDG